MRKASEIKEEIAVHVKNELDRTESVAEKVEKAEREASSSSFSSSCDDSIPSPEDIYPSMNFHGYP